MLQCLQRQLRSYSTQVRPTPELARTLSTPHAVRLRRTQRFGPIKPGTTDAAPSGLSPSDKIKYRRLRALDKLPRNSLGNLVSEHQYRDLINQKRSRIRGIQTQHKKVLGQPVYLPNIIFRLIRNFTPPGEQYNPYEATFRVTKNITKTDVRSFLFSVYGLDVTYIRTIVYNTGSIERGKKKGSRTATLANHKRVVVGLKDPFYYPLRVEDMSVEDQEAHTVWLEENYGIEESKARIKRNENMVRAMSAGDPNLQALTPNAVDEIPSTPGMERVEAMKENIKERERVRQRTKQRERRRRKSAQGKGLVESEGKKDVTLGDL